jgi:GT2 family glycosyltransferase
MSGPTTPSIDGTDDALVASLIIGTRNRAAQLARTFRALCRLQVSHPWEVILVDSASTDGTCSMLDDFAATSGLPVRIVTTSRPGLGCAHNAGARIARGRILVFTDDDCYPAPDFVDQVVAVFGENPHVGFVGGRILLFDPADYPITIRTEMVEQHTRPGTVVSAGFIHGANMAFRRDTLESVQYFDEALGPGTPFNCEDADVVARISLAGWAGMYSPRPLVYHHHGRRTRREVRALSHSYARGRGAFYMKLVMERRTRAVALRSWYESQAWALGEHGLRAIPELLRELYSAAGYVVLRIARTHRARQRFSVADGLVVRERRPPGASDQTTA